MKVRILKTDKRLGIKAGEVYTASPYSLDPGSKVIIEHRIPDGYEPLCTQYRDEIEILTETCSQ